MTHLSLKHCSVCCTVVNIIYPQETVFPDLLISNPYNIITEDAMQVLKQDLQNKENCTGEKIKKKIKNIKFKLTPNS
jgi:hypothetical protein